MEKILLGHGIELGGIKMMRDPTRGEAWPPH
jgi:hypothetical protein